VYSDLYSTCAGAPPIVFNATVTVSKPLRINGVAYLPGETFKPHDGVQFVVASGCAASLDVTYLSQAAAPWGTDIYDSSSQHISSLGCALTSLTMAMRFAGASDATPRTLNNAANALPDGYVGQSVNWVPIAGTRGLTYREGGARVNSAVSAQAANDYLDRVLCEIGRPVIIGVFNKPVTGASCDKVCHYVLVTGRTSDGKYLIADPGNRNNTTLDAYGNHFETRGYVLGGGGQARVPSTATAATSEVEQLSVAVSGGVNLLLLDTSQRETGINPASGARTEDIPNSAHFIDSLSDDETGEDGEATQSVYVSNPPFGRYEVRVTPFADGPFRISATALSAGGTYSTPLLVDGIGTAGQTQVYYLLLESSRLGNISTRLTVGTGDNAMIGGFIVTGSQPKTIIVRGIGPSLMAFGVPATLTDPIIEVHDSSGALIPGAVNDNWQDAATKQQVLDSGLAPAHALESALWGTIDPGAYTVIVRGKNGETGNGLFEVFDLDQNPGSKLANVSTRGFVNTGDNVMIAGTIITGVSSATILIRAVGPSLIGAGLANALGDPTAELRDQNGALVAANDDWRSDQESEIIATTIPPSDNLESAILRTLAPGTYTAIVRGYQNSTGVAVVEAYQLE
jgi:hypothetical protein